jgi:Flp pilus assembly protein TadD
MIAAYESLGAALFASGQPESAIETFRRGLQVNPLSAILNYDLSLVLSQRGDRLEAARALALATKIEPSIILNHEK